MHCDVDYRVYEYIVDSKHLPLCLQDLLVVLCLELALVNSLLVQLSLHSQWHCWILFIYSVLSKKLFQKTKG